MSPDYALALLEATFSEAIPFWAMVLVIVLLSIVAVGAGLMLYEPIRHWFFPPPRDSFIGDNLPFHEILEDGSTVLCKNGSLSVFYMVDGFNMLTADPDTHRLQFASRKEWLDTLAPLGIEVRNFVIRDAIPNNMPLDFNNRTLENLFGAYIETFNTSYVKNQVIMLTTQKNGDIEVLRKAQELTTAKLKNYGIRQLSQSDPIDNYRPLSVISRLVSPISRPNLNGRGFGVSYVVCPDRLQFAKNGGLVRWRNGRQTMYGAIVSIKTLGESTDEHLITYLSQLDCELVLSNICSPFKGGNRQIIRQTLSMRKNRSAIGAVAGERIMMMYDELISSVMGEGQRPLSLWNYNMVLTLYHHDIDELQKYVEVAQAVISDFQATGVREGSAVQAGFFHQFPEFPMEWPRVWLFTSENVAAMMPFDGAPFGISSSDWGPGPIVTLPTINGSTYQFQFHVTDKPRSTAHMLLVGSTESGKTTLTSFLLAGTMRHPQHRVYAFDRFKGMEIITKSIGGTYTAFDGSGPALNPLDTEMSSTKKLFLDVFFKSIASVQDDDPLADQISTLIDRTFRLLPREHRSLRNAVVADVIKRDHPLRQRFNRWINPETPKGSLFNAKKDTLDLTESRWVGFDCDFLYTDDELARVAITYLVHRIEEVLINTNSTASIFIDEAAALLEHPVTREWFKDAHRQYRKLGGSVISAFQEPKRIAELGLSDLLRGQAQTVLFFPNRMARWEDYKDWELNEKEFSFISSGGWDYPRAALLKRYANANNESVILDVDLSGIGPYLRLFRADNLARMQCTHLEDVQNLEWVDQYIFDPPTRLDDAA
jgi:type IV secretion system protein VirB4